MAAAPEPAVAPDISALTFNAACLWEAFTAWAISETHHFHEQANEMSCRLGACECRSQIAGYAADIERDWQAAGDNVRDGWGAPFDWEYTPRWLAHRLGFTPAIVTTGDT